MSDDEYSEEEIIVVKEKKIIEKEGADFLKQKQQDKNLNLEEQLNIYIEEWRKQRRKEDDALVRLKEHQKKRRAVREQEEKKLLEKKKQDEERRLKEVEEKKRADLEEKKRRLEEAERKRQNMKDGAGDSAFACEVEAMKAELIKSKEQLEEDKKISLGFRIKPLELKQGMDKASLKKKAKELWEVVVKLETDKYDLEERQKRQDYDLKELKERQKQQLRQKAAQLGLEPEALTGKYPPKIRVVSKYERRMDTRTYDDKKKLFEGGIDEINKEIQEKAWGESKKAWEERMKSKLPKWFGERPGKKKGEPDTPEEEEITKGDATAARLDLDQFAIGLEPLPDVDVEEEEEEEEEDEE